MGDELKIYELEYTYLQSMWGECARGRKVYHLVAEGEDEAFIKGDKLFGSISGQHKTLLEGASSVHDGGDPHGYGILSDFEKTIKEYNPVRKISGPTLSESGFSLEARVISNDGNTVTIKFIPKIK